MTMNSHRVFFLGRSSFADLETGSVNARVGDTGQTGQTGNSQEFDGRMDNCDEVFA